MAAQRSEQPLYDVYLARVINIEAVQCHRGAVTDEKAQLCFFAAGYRPGEFDGFQWSLDAPREDFLGGPMGFVMAPVSVPMKPALDAAVAAFKEFIKALANGELIANGEHPATSVRHDLDPAEWTRANLILDVRNGDLIEWHWNKHVRSSSNDDLIEYIQHVRWSTMTLRAAIQEQKLGRIDWDDWWKYEIARRQQGLLPNKKDYLREAAPRIEERYGVTSVDGGDLRRFKVALYRGDSERPKRSKRKKSQPEG
jgi:hypothetical protein